MKAAWKASCPLLEGERAAVSSSFQRSASLKVLSTGGGDTNAATTNKHNPLLSPSHIADPSLTS